MVALLKSIIRAIWLVLSSKNIINRLSHWFGDRDIKFLRWYTGLFKALAMYEPSCLREKLIAMNEVVWFFNFKRLGPVSYHLTQRKFIYRRIPQLRPPFVHASFGQKWGGGLFAGSLHFFMTTITDRWMPCGRTITVLSLAIWWVKFKKKLMKV